MKGLQDFAFGGLAVLTFDTINTVDTISPMLQKEEQIHMYYGIATAILGTAFAFCTRKALEWYDKRRQDQKDVKKWQDKQKIK